MTKIYECRLLQSGLARTEHGQTHCQEVGIRDSPEEHIRTGRKKENFYPNHVITNYCKKNHEIASDDGDTRCVTCDRRNVRNMTAINLHLSISRCS